MRLEHTAVCAEALQILNLFFFAFFEVQVLYVQVWMRGKVCEAGGLSVAQSLSRHGQLGLNKSNQSCSLSSAPQLYHEHHD